MLHQSIEGSLNPTVEVLHFDGTGLTEKQQASNAIRIVGISDLGQQGIQGIQGCLGFWLSW